MLQFTKNQVRAIKDYIKGVDSNRLHFRCLHGTDSGHYLTSGESLIKIDDDSDNRIYPYDLFDKINKAMKKNDIAYIKKYALIDGTKIEYEPINEQSPQFDKAYPDRPIQYKAEFKVKNLKHVIDFLDKYTNEEVIKLQFHGKSTAVEFICGDVSGLIMPTRSDDKHCLWQPDKNNEYYFSDCGHKSKFIKNALYCPFCCKLIKYVPVINPY